MKPLKTIVATVSQPVQVRTGSHQPIEQAQRWKLAAESNLPTALAGLLLKKAIIYEEQCRDHLGLTLQQRKVLEQVARQAATIRTKVSILAPDGLVNGRAKPRLPFAIGTEFVREWQGCDQFVVMTADGLLWSGQTYGSLSAVARAITGTRWNGLRFFGLDKKRAVS